MKKTKGEVESKLEWLILPNERRARYTNFGDGRPGDTSVLVAKVNANQDINKWHTDWRLPTCVELKSLVNNKDNPGDGMYWSSSPLAEDSDSAWFFCFNYGHFDIELKSTVLSVRLVRTV